MSDNTFYMETMINQSAEFTFRYESYGFGCATIKMSTCKQNVIFDASYIGVNPIEDMLETLAETVCDNYDDCQLFWSSEPGTLLVTIEKEESNAHILVDEFDQDIDYRKVNDAQWVRMIDTVIPLMQLVDVVIKEAERNLKLHGLVGFSEDWCDHTDVFPLSAYLRLKGIGYECGDDNLRKSSLEEELQLLSGLLKKGNEDAITE